MARDLDDGVVRIQEHIPELGGAGMSAAHACFRLLVGAGGGQQFGHAAVTQYSLIVIRVRPANHPAHQSGYLQSGADTLVCRNTRPLPGQTVQACFSARAMISTTRTEDKRFGSSKEADVVVEACSTRIYECSPDQ